MLRKVFIFFTAINFAIGCVPIDPEPDPLPQNDFKVHPLYIVPADQDYVDDHAARVWRGIYETQNWYQTATGGLTFELLDEENTIEVYFTDHVTDYYTDDWWGLLLEELSSKDYPVQSPGTILMIWVEGISDVGGDELALGGWSCDGDCGAAIMPISTLISPTRLPTDMGVVFHELGHALGLAHPVEEDDLPLSTEDEAMFYSVMCQSNLRAATISSDHGFLTSEKAALINNPFMKPDVLTYQDFWSTNIINYPELGPVPVPEFEYEILPSAVVQFSANVEDGLLYYWYFGDGYTSSEQNPKHAYGSYGTYNVRLMVTTENFMSERTSKFIKLD